MQTNNVRVVDLKVENVTRPIGFDLQTPRLSWRIEGHGRNIEQDSYRILVSNTEDSLRSDNCDIWDSGRIRSNRSIGIKYEGGPLVSRQRYWWAVEVWEKGRASSLISEPSWWEMGLLSREDWVVDWMAVETPESKADRDAGFKWVWTHNPTSGESPNKFRLKFLLSTQSRCGELFVSTTHFTRIEGLWIDGTSIDHEQTSGVRTEEWLALGPLASGEHVIAIEAKEHSVKRMHSSTPIPPAITFLARLHMQNNEIQRIECGAACRTGLSFGCRWRTPDFDETGWHDVALASAGGRQPLPPAPAMYLRQEFTIDKSVAKARLYASALGAYRASLNGALASDSIFSPEFSQYAKRVLYRVYDVSHLIQPGLNALGLTVGDGWYASFEKRFAWGLPPRRVIAQLEVTFADGTRKQVITNVDWRGMNSPIVRSEITNGETYDARMEQPGWDAAGFDDSKWHAIQTAEPPPCRLTAQVDPPLRATEILSPLSVSSPRPGLYVVDFGQVFCGRCRLRLTGYKGQRIELRFAELVKPSGEIDQASLDAAILKRTNFDTDVFILKGDPAGEILEPSFSFRGLRYAEITGLSDPLSPEAVQGIVIHSDIKPTGQMRTASSLINKIWRNIVWTQRSNFVSIQTDNPTRERRGWLGDAGLFWDTASFNMDVSAFTSRFMENVTDDQYENGAFTMHSPYTNTRRFIFEDKGSPPAWGDAAIILPWTTWQRYGDLGIVERNWSAMNRYLDFIQKHNPDYVWRNMRGADWGDWIAVGEKNSVYDSAATPSTPKDLIASAYWAYSAKLLAQMAQAVSRDSDASRLEALFEEVRAAFNRNFVSSDCEVGNGSQTSYVLALQFGLLSTTAARAAAENLAADVRGRGVALTTGILGTRFILDVLAEFGYSDLAYGLLQRTAFPSWGYMIINGATGIWEYWPGTSEYGTSSMKMSQNQPALGSIGGFIFRRVVGIDAALPGFEAIRIRPLIDETLGHAGGDYESVVGRISTSWKSSRRGEVTLNVTTPPNTTTYFHIPVLPRSNVRESGRALEECHDLKIQNRSDSEVVVVGGSGTYTFDVETP